MYGLIFFLVMLFIGWFFGRMAERKHLARLDIDEAALAHIQTSNIKTVPSGFLPGGVLVSGNVVVAVDFFKVFIAGWKTLFGGHLRSYESLLDRARREALVRLLKQANDLGADAVYNVRYEFSSIGNQPSNTGGGVELLAYGTALKRA